MTSADGGRDSPRLFREVRLLIHVHQEVNSTSLQWVCLCLVGVEGESSGLLEEGRLDAGTTWGPSTATLIAPQTAWTGSLCSLFHSLQPAFFWTLAV